MGVRSGVAGSETGTRGWTEGSGWARTGGRVLARGVGEGAGSIVEGNLMRRHCWRLICGRVGDAEGENWVDGSSLSSSPQLC